MFSSGRDADSQTFYEEGS